MTMTLSTLTKQRRKGFGHAIRIATLAVLLIALITFSIRASSTISTSRLRIPLQTNTSEATHQNDGVSFRSLCYHDIRDHLRDTMKEWPQRSALDTYDLIQHFSWLKENGYHPISLNDILTARHGGKKLPPKAILLTFDDGYLSVYTRVFPLLKLFNYPAVIGLVGEWLDKTKTGKVFYGDHWISREHFVTWPQVREMLASGLIEVASHSYGLHKGQISNPQGNQPPSTITRIFNPNKKRYETDAIYKARIRNDLKKNSTLIARQIGQHPRAMIWPYGAYNMIAVEAAKEVGMPITMTLEAGTNTPNHPLNRIRRSMLVYTDNVADLKRTLNQAAAYDGEEHPLNHAVGINLDILYDPDPVKQDKKVGQLVERILQMRANMVYLNAYADLNNNGKVDALYFPNRHLPMRADLLNRVAWQLQTRGTILAHSMHVYVALPTTGFELAEPAQNKIKDIYVDAAKNAPRVTGILLDDTARGKQPAQNDHFATELIARFKIYQPHSLVIRKHLSTWLTKNTKAILTKKKLNQQLQSYDFVMLSVPLETNSKTHINHLIQRAKASSNGLTHLMFELQTLNPVTNTTISSSQFIERLQQLHLNGARNFGYFPDDVRKDKPALKMLRPLMSLKTNPGRKP